jgi:hypothetical protein
MLLNEFLKEHAKVQQLEATVDALATQIKEQSPASSCERRCAGRCASFHGWQRHRQSAARFNAWAYPICPTTATLP